MDFRIAMTLTPLFRQRLTVEDAFPKGGERVRAHELVRAAGVYMSPHSRPSMLFLSIILRPVPWQTSATEIFQLESRVSQYSKTSNQYKSKCKLSC